MYKPRALTKIYGYTYFITYTHTYMHSLSLYMNLMLSHTQNLGETSKAHTPKIVLINDSIHKTLLGENPQQ